MKSDILERIHTLDPARGQEFGPVSADDLALRAILAEPRVTGPATQQERARRRPRLVIAAATTVAVAAAVTVGMLAPWNTPPAFASWTATPAHLSAVQIDQRVAQCPRTDPRPASVSKSDATPLDPVLVDARGDYTFVISTGDDVFVQCYLQTDADGAVRAETAQAGPLNDEQVGSTVTTVSNGVTIWNYGPDGGGAIALAYGRAAPDVVSVTTTMGDGRVITATVQGGWWAMWVPGETPLPQTAQVRHADGSTATVTIRQPE